MSNKADKYLKETITEILEEGQWDKEPRTRWSDGTPAHSKFVTQKVYQYDISKGEFPINTLRTTALKGALGEILTIYRDQSNKQEDFIKNGVNWWGDWMNEEGNLGTAYAWNLEPTVNEDKIIPVKKRVLNEELFNTVEPIRLKNLEENIIGSYLDRYIVLDSITKIDERGVKFFKIQFIKSGYITEMRENFLYKSKGVDVYDRSVFNIGYMGFYKDIKFISDKHKSILKDKWENMFRRCYSSKYESRKLYKDVFVHQEWHSFENFLKTIVYVPQYFSAKRDDFRGWDLDKDYFSSNGYSKDTCVFLKGSDNKLYSSGKLCNYGNNLFLSYDACAKFIGTYSRKIKEIVNGEIRNPFAKELSKVVLPDNISARKSISKNQLNELLYNMENNPFSRRHSISFYNWSHYEGKQLVECAYETLWSVREFAYNINRADCTIIRYIDLTLMQRSQDFLTTSSINPAQYTMLATMVANHLTFKTGIKHEVGKLLHIVQNCHIYDRHLDAAKEILKREPTGLQPKIELICEPKDYYSHTIEDFKFSGLEGIEKLSNNLEIAI